MTINRETAIQVLKEHPGARVCYVRREVRDSKWLRTEVSLASDQTDVIPTGGNPQRLPHDAPFNLFRISLENEVATLSTQLSDLRVRAQALAS